MAEITPMRPGQYHTSEKGNSYLTVNALGPPDEATGTPSNVWTAVDAETHEEVFIIKQPSPSDDETKGYPLFTSEMIMHELFKDCPYIRKQVDRIPPDAPALSRTSSEFGVVGHVGGGEVDPPRLVLEPTETTLSRVRTERPLSDGEIEILMRGVLLGLGEIHKRGLVYADLKMDNILVNGFRGSVEETARVFLLEAKLGDLGIVMPPMYGKVQPISYRAPEVYFKSLVTPAADIWSWGVIYCQLLEAQVEHDKDGMHDNLHGSTVALAEDLVKQALSEEFDLANVEYYQDCNLPKSEFQRVKNSWADNLLKKGVSRSGVEFLTWVLNPDPERRPNAAQILGQTSWVVRSPAIPKEATEATKIDTKDLKPPPKSTSYFPAFFGSSQNPSRKSSEGGVSSPPKTRETGLWNPIQNWLKF
ncbi:kinase-like protein [Tothia fuscella]|uniref:Kinase-like protein n=1 Tax=Tothia fuscella TaxID=1048955 RepID=A0A9P4U1I1_9PEZI|nr:kinase-like protein [Tothia fuscella]